MSLFSRTKKTTIFRLFSAPANHTEVTRLSNPNAIYTDPTQTKHSIFTRDSIISRCFSQATTGNRVRTSGYVLAPLGIEWLQLQRQLLRNASTATAGKPLPPGGDSNDQKMVKEASPEECDQAVEGLTMAKLKAKSKKHLETPKEVKSLLTKIETIILRIVPSLRALASMTRFFFQFFNSDSLLFLVSVFLELGIN